MFSFFKNLFGFTTENYGSFHSESNINPSTGLPMIDNVVDVHGNPYGTDIHEHTEMGIMDTSDSFTGFDDMF